MELIELSWLQDWPSLKEALTATLGCSGQHIKRYFSSKEQNRSVKAKEVARLSINFVNHLKINPLYIGPAVKVLSENENFLVLHKPPGVHCHPLSYEDKDTLLNFLANNKKWETLCINESNYDRGLLYRLDFETSGVIVLAKSEMKLKDFRQSFSLNMRKKFYLAIVDGDFNKEGKWVHYFRAYGQKGLLQKVTDMPVQESHEGSLAVMKIFSDNGKSLILVNLKTGLRHQIRAQLSHLGFPLLGDELYGGNKAERLYLHALRYEFSDTVEDPEAELFGLFFDLNRALEVCHNMFGRF